MASNDPPLPEKIQNYPRDRKLNHLFSKKITETEDLKRSIAFLNRGNEFIRNNVSESLQQRFVKNGVSVKVYAPNVDDLEVTMRRNMRGRLPCFSVSFNQAWDRKLGLRYGDEINCWCIHHKPQEGDGEEEEFSLLVEKVLQIKLA
ncbi:hypothetical protein Patl1_22607 [Pistacia atlantica]|uniref:Uncharacterized protein n=1 Tax=Pistacia atlantica TaxID=434234 RepID=A0ACC0ZXF2_9ROSI|nr:hypothetical protein Patl1_22607 [Pistacia atlantica]